MPSSFGRREKVAHGMFPCPRQLFGIGVSFGLAAPWHAQGAPCGKLIAVRVVGCVSRQGRRKLVRIDDCDLQDAGRTARGHIELHHGRHATIGRKGRPLQQLFVGLDRIRASRLLAVESIKIERPRETSPCPWSCASSSGASRKCGGNLPNRLAAYELLRGRGLVRTTGGLLHRLVLGRRRLCLLVGGLLGCGGGRIRICHQNIPLNITAIFCR